LNLATRPKLSLEKTATMENEKGEIVDLYVPRKCSDTNRVISAKDHASVQLNVGHTDANGVYTGQYTTVAFCGQLRGMGESDVALNRLADEAGIIKDLNAFPKEHKFRRDA